MIRETLSRHRNFGYTSPGKPFVFPWLTFRVTQGDASSTIFSLSILSRVRRYKEASPHVTTSPEFPFDHTDFALDRGSSLNFWPCGYEGRNSCAHSDDSTELTAPTALLGDRDGWC